MTVFNLIAEAAALAEARQPQWAYTEKRVKGALSKVTLALEGADSGAMTRLAKRYERLDKSAKLLKEKRDELNAAVKEVGDRIFDAEDAVATRIIDTISYTVMLTASEKAENKKPTPRTDFESAYSELAKLVPELTEQVNAIRAKYTEMIPPKDTPVGLRVKAKIEEGLLSSIKAMWSKFMDSVKQWARSYDSKLAALKAKYPTKGKRVVEAVEDEETRVMRFLKRAEAKLPYKARYKLVDIYGKTIHWVTQETDGEEGDETAVILAELLTEAGFPGWTVKVTVRDEYTGPKNTNWQGEATS